LIELYEYCPKKERFMHTAKINLDVPKEPLEGYINLR
jgi:hypothetical protein